MSICWVRMIKRALRAWFLPMDISCTWHTGRSPPGRIFDMLRPYDATCALLCQAIRARLGKQRLYGDGIAAKTIRFGTAEDLLADSGQVLPRIFGGAASSAPTRRIYGVGDIAAPHRHCDVT